MNQFKQRVHNIFLIIKRGEYNEKLPPQFPIYDTMGNEYAFLRPLTEKTLYNFSFITLLARWRSENSLAFPTQFKITTEGTKNWLQNAVLKNPSRMLFFIGNNERKIKLIGHIGLATFNFRDHSCEIDNVVRGEKNYLKGVMTYALKTLVKWTQNVLLVKKIYLRVFSDNTHAITFYKKCGFVEHSLVPLHKVSTPHLCVWKEDKKLKKAEKYFLKMILPNP